MLPTASECLPSTSDSKIMKEKLEQTRTYYEDGFRKRAACLCFRDKTESEVLLVSSSRHKGKWIVPGGGVEPDEDIKLAATREVYEEAGAIGRVEKLLGLVENEDKKTRTTVFSFLVTELSDEWEDNKILGRTRDWFPIEEARDKLCYHAHISYLNLLTIPS